MDTVLTLHREAQRQYMFIEICWKTGAIQYVEITESDFADRTLCFWKCKCEDERLAYEAVYIVWQEYIILGEGANKNFTCICDGRNPWRSRPSKAVICRAIVLEGEKDNLLAAECLTDIAVNGDVAHSTRDDLNGFDRSYLDNAHHKLFPNPILIS